MEARDRRDRREDGLTSDYVALDLSSAYNGGLELLSPELEPRLGIRSLRGIPFSFGEDEGECLVALGVGLGQRPVTLPIGRTAPWVVFAHRLLESRVPEGGPAGDVVAEYRFRFRGGDEVRRPVRERFEIACPTDSDRVGFHPVALAIADQPMRLMPRFEGWFGKAGRRQMDIDYAPFTYLLWAWRNPRSEEVIDEIVVTPTHRRLVIGAVTLGLLDEHPLVPTAARPVGVEFIDPEMAEGPFDVELSIDRGIAGFAYPLPRGGSEAFLSSGMPGFGIPFRRSYLSSEGAAPINVRSASPAYAQVAAVPSATLSISHAGSPIDEVRWADVETRDEVVTDAVRVRLLESGRTWVRTSVLDADTGTRLPCRIHFRSPDGVPYQPHGHHPHINGELGSYYFDVGGDLQLGEVTYAYIDGRCEGWLPTGEVLVDVAHGFEYEPLRAQLHIEPGQRELTLELRRWSNLAAKGWFSGDTHVHMLSTSGAQLEARAEDLNVVNLLASQWAQLFTNTEDLIGRPVVSNDGQTIVYASQENRQHFLGHLGLLGLAEPVMPWCSDGPHEAEVGGSMETVLAHWADECRAQGGTVILPHFPAPNGEPASLIATGRVDAIELINDDSAFLQDYYRYVNCGYRLPIVGGTDKMSSDIPVGLYRTYVQIPNGEFDYDNWCRNLRAGRTFMTSGPILEFQVDGHDIGDTVNLPASGGTVEVRATASSIFPLNRIELVMGGQVVASTEEPRGAQHLELSTSVAVREHTWLAARTGAGKHRPIRHADAQNRGVMAHTSPIYVACGGEWSMFDPVIADDMVTLVDIALAHVQEMTLRYPDRAVWHRHGEEDHQAYLERPFHEAMEALRDRQAGHGKSEHT
jgi:hypothetical protein